MVKESWSQRHEVEQHSRAVLQLRNIFSSCVQCTIEFVTRTLQLCTIFSSCVQCKREFVTRTLRRAALTSRTTSMYTERARRLTSTHPATLSRISTWLSLALLVPLEYRSQQLRQLVEGVLIHAVHSAKESPPSEVHLVLFPHQTPRLVDRLPHLGSRYLSDGRCYDHHHYSYCSHLLEHVLPSAGSEALPRSRRGHQTNKDTALSTVSHGPSRYPIVRTSWYRLRSPYASLPANLESVAETWKRLAPSFWAPIASKFF